MSFLLIFVLDFAVNFAVGRGLNRSDRLKCFYVFFHLQILVNCFHIKYIEKHGSETFSNKCCGILNLIHFFFHPDRSRVLRPQRRLPTRPPSRVRQGYHLQLLGRREFVNLSTPKKSESFVNCIGFIFKYITFFFILFI